MSANDPAIQNESLASRSFFSGVTGKLKLAMAISTVLWIAAMPSCVAVNLSRNRTVMREAERRFIASHPGSGFIAPSGMKAGLSIGACVGGVLGPTFVFGVAMTGLGVAYFVTRR